MNELPIKPSSSQPIYFPLGWVVDACVVTTLAVRKPELLLFCVPRRREDTFLFSLK